MAAVVVADEHDGALRSAIAACRSKLTVPSGKHLHWVEHVKKYPRRQFVTSALGALTGIQLNYVVIEKAAIPATAALRNDQVIFYNYIAGLTMERILLTARTWPGGSRDVLVHFGHVRGFDHDQTLQYFRLKRHRADEWAGWHLLRGDVKFMTMGSLDGLQAADQYSGMLKVALFADDYGGYEPHHLLAVRHQIRRVNGKSWGYGMKVLATAGTIEGLPWWPAEGL
jgi:hypothetical protein